MMRFFSHKKHHILAFCFLLLILLVPMMVTHAQESAGTDALSQTHRVTNNDISMWDGVAGIVHWLEQLLLSLAAFILWLCGMVFDIVIVDYVARFGETYTTYKDTIVAIWTLVRDLCNLMFIFGFIYIGIMTILSPEKASTKKFLGSLIVCAVLINFSLYFTQLIIDISNFIATQIYNSFPTDKGISLAITNALHLDGFWANLTPDALEKLGKSTGAEFSFYLGAFIFVLVTALMLLFAALLLFVRFVELIIIMMFSPIIFGARVFPQTKKYSDSIIQKLLSQSFFAPAYLFLLFVTLKVVNTLGKPQTPFNDLFANGAKGGASSGTSAFQVIIIFIIGIIMLWKSLELAKKSGLHGSDFAIKSATATRKWAQGVAGRTAVRTASGVNTGVSWAGKKLTGDKVNIGHFKNIPDVAQRMRGSNNMFARATGDLLGATAGAAVTGTMGAKFGSGSSVSSIDNERKADRKVRLAHEEKEARKAAMETALKDTEDPTKDLAKAVRDLAKAVGKMTNEEIEKMSQKQLTNPRVAANITDEHIKHLRDSGTKTPAEIKAIEDARKAARENIANEGDAVLNAGEVQNRFTSAGLTLADADNYMHDSQEGLMRGDASKIPVEFFTNPQMAPYIRPDALAKRITAGVTSKELADIKTHLEPWINAAGSAHTKDMWRKWSTKNQVGIRFGMIIR